MNGTGDHETNVGSIKNLFHASCIKYDECQNQTKQSIFLSKEKRSVFIDGILGGRTHSFAFLIKFNHEFQRGEIFEWVINGVFDKFLNWPLT